MLEHLDIRNFALIENLSIDFSMGFNVLTGETGAGKSIILGAVSLLLGEKTDSKIIRNGEEECIVNAVFSIPDKHEVLDFLEENGLETEDGSLYIKRIVKAKGARGKITIQGQVVSRTQLAYISNSLIDMHFQQEHQSLLLSDRQRKILDSFAETEKEIEDYRRNFEELNQLKGKRIQLEREIQSSLKEQDYLKFVVEEINKVNPKIGEDDKLEEEIKVLSNYENIYSNLEMVIQNLKSSKENIYDGEQYLNEAFKNDKSLLDTITRLESSRLELEDIYDNVREKFSTFSFSEEHLDNIQDRFSKIQRLRKYGKTLEAILDYRDKIALQLSNCENSEIELSKLEKSINACKERLVQKAEFLSIKRKKAALELQKKVEEKLRLLAMPSVVFIIDIEEIEFSAYGKDEITFKICPNIGETLKPLNLIASGGELSRIMLALKTVLSDVDEVQTQIFDEVDSGVGGEVAKSVATQLKELSINRQVIAITHLAVIASQADSQFVVSKYQENGRTFSKIQEVKGKEREKEIARMLSGQVNDVALKHASSLLN
ncbi:MAG: DNA repair protein RecN [Sphaerochaetaceae bacterium]|nr:DNA repair protein RecN [Sphaerochaetaceae bacterium]